MGISIIARGSIIKNPIAKRPDTETGLAMRHSVKDLVAAGGAAAVSAWRPSYSDPMFEPGREVLQLPSGSIAPQLVLNAKDGIPAVRFNQPNSRLASGHRQGGGTPAAIYAENGAVTFSCLMRYNAPPASQNTRIIGSNGGAQAGVRGGAAAEDNRIILIGQSGNFAGPPYHDLNGPIGEWFAFSATFDFATNKACLYVNDQKTGLEYTSPSFGSYWAGNVLGGGWNNTVAVPAFDYVETRVYFRELSKTDALELHEIMRLEHGVGTWRS